jgi:hypothetical protein
MSSFVSGQNSFYHLKLYGTVRRQKLSDFVELTVYCQWKEGMGGARFYQ